MGCRNIQSFQIFEKKIPKFFEVLNGLKWILRYERALKSDFCGLHFVQPSSIIGQINSVSEIV